MQHKGDRQWDWGKWDCFSDGRLLLNHIKHILNQQPQLNFAGQPRKELAYFTSPSGTWFSVAVLILEPFPVLTQLKFIHLEPGEQICLQYFRGSLNSVLYSATKPLLFLLGILQQILPMIIFASVTEGKLPFWAALMHEA